MRGMLLGGGFAVFVGLALGCAPKPAEPPPAAEPAPAPPPPPPKSDVADDRVDLAQLNDIIEDWHKAWKSGNKAAERNADARLNRWINQELAEDREQVREANQEAAAPSGGAKASADDHKDAQKQQGEAQRTRDLAKRLQNMQPAFDNNNANPQQYEKKSTLLKQLQEVARRELQRSKQEAAEDSQPQGGGQKAGSTSGSGGGQKATNDSGGGGGKSGNQQDAEEKIGPKKLVAAINKWLEAHNNKQPKIRKEADQKIKLWWKQELARAKPWTPRSKEIALWLKKTQPAFNKNEATPQQYGKKKELLIELRKIAKARIK